MVRKSALRIMLVFAVSLLAVTPVLAGGWAVITLDELPGEITPGQPLAIGFMVRQHGSHPMEGLEPTITLVRTGTRGRLTVPAVAGDEAGHYRATLNFPTEGRWNWSIQAFSMNQEMPPLTVGSATIPTREASGMAFPLPAAAGGLGVLLTLVAFGILLRQRARWAIPLVAAGLLVSSFGFLSAAAGSSPAAPPKVPVGSFEGTGRQLFLAKGCITCHNHDEVSREGDTIFVDVGPDLSTLTADPAYLRSWLHDPVSIKPETLMPDLDLADGEIEALVAFLNAK